MKTTILLLTAAALAAGNWQTFAQQDDSVSPEPQNTEAPAAEMQAADAQPAEAQSAETKDAEAPSTLAEPAKAEGSTDGIRMDFRNAPLESVLTYLSDAAGFIIVSQTPLNGRVNIMSRQPVSKDEAVELLNGELSRNGYAARRDGRTLTILDRNTARQQTIPVRMGGNPDSVPANSEFVTQIIPIRFVEARQLLSDLTDYISSEARVVANEAGNTIIITDTQANIRHLMEIINAIDNSAEGETIVQSFHLDYANPTEVVAVLSSLFPDTGSAGGTQNPLSFLTRGGRGGRGGNRGGGNFGAAGGGQNDRAQKQQKVVAVADLRTVSVVVTAAKDMMPQIANLIEALDVKSDRDLNVATIRLKNADPNQVAMVLQSMFQDQTRRNNLSQQQQQSPLMTRQYNNANSSSTTVSAGINTSFGSTTGGARRGN